MSADRSSVKNDDGFLENTSTQERHSLEKGIRDETSERVYVSEEDNKRILRKTDLHVLPILLVVYFLQILDKSIIGYSAVFGLRENAHLVGNQYSMIGSIGYYAQLGAQPLGSFLLVKIAPRPFMVVVVFCWGVSLCGMAASTNYASLMATRFLLGAFEACVLPLFSLITTMWYRRSEQPLRVAAWYGTNGLATILGSIMVYGLGHIKSGALHSYQIIFLVFGLITVLIVPWLYFKLDNNVSEARFLSPEDRLKGVERLRANQTGLATNKFQSHQLLELALDPKTYLFLACAFCVNVGASVSNVFGPLILRGLVGFTAYEATLLNMPFGALQLIMIISSSYAAVKFKNKSGIFAAYMVPVVIGAALLFAVPQTKSNKGALLVGYYLLSGLFAANPLIVSWIAANTAGQSKKSTLFSMYNAASAAGNIVGPYLFKAKDAPSYRPGLKAVMAIFCALIGLIGLLVLYLVFLNKRKESTRVKNGKPAKIVDRSMTNKYESGEADANLGSNAFKDLTDKENDEFVYLY